MNFKCRNFPISTSRNMICFFKCSHFGFDLMGRKILSWKKYVRKKNM
jgi:hypothetical protein